MPAAAINFINKSMAVSPVDVVFFEPAEFYDDQTIRSPWVFIRQCSYDFSYPFLYDFSMTMQLRDDWGNFSPPQKVKAGMRYVIRSVNGKEKLMEDGLNNSPEVEIFNELESGAPSVTFSRNGKITATRTSLAPGEFFSFSIPNALLARKITGPSQALKLKQLENDGYSTRIEMSGLESTEVILTGGGTGASAKKYLFTLQNIIHS